MSFSVRELARATAFPASAAYDITEAQLWALLAAAAGLSELHVRSILLPQGAVAAPGLRALILGSSLQLHRPACSTRGGPHACITPGLLDGLRKLFCSFDSLDTLCATLAALPQLQQALITLTPAAAASHCSYAGLQLEQFKGH